MPEYLKLNYRAIATYNRLRESVTGALLETIFEFNTTQYFAFGAVLKLFGTLSRLTFQQFAKPFFISVGVGLLLVWLSQALRLIYLVFSNSDAFDEYLYVTVLSLPASLGTLLPLAMAGSIVTVLVSQHRSGEGIVMATSGLSQFQRAAPLMYISTFVMIAVYFSTMYAGHTANRELRRVMAEVRSDFIASLMQEGRFNNPTDNMMFFARERSSDGILSDIFVSDRREKNKAIYYQAKSGYLTKRSENVVIMVLIDGNLVSTSTDSPSLQRIKFNNYTIDLTSLTETQVSLGTTESEYTMSELLYPQSGAVNTDAKRRAVLAQLYSRFGSGLYPLALVLVISVIFGSPRSSRQPVIGKVALVALAVVTVQAVGIASVDLAKHNEGLHWVLVGFPLIVILTSLVVIIARSRFPQNMDSQATDAVPAYLMRGDG